MAKFIVAGHTGRDIFNKLHAAGLLPANPDFVRRCVIDLEVGSAAKIYYETYADDMEGKIGEVLVSGLTIPKETK